MAWTYEMVVTQTGKSHMRDRYQIFHEGVEYFQTKREVRNALRERYKTRFGRPMRGSPMYRDIEGKPKRVGRIYGYWNKDISHNSKPWFQQDWVEIRKIKRVYGW